MSETEQSHVGDTADEARLNRGIVTVFEQTKDTENADAGDRSLSLGYHPDKQHILDHEKQDFVSVAVPIAHIELHEPIAEDALGEWVQSDVAQLALNRFFPEMEPDDVVTEFGAERGLEGETTDE